MIFKDGKVKTLTSTEDAFNVALEVYGYILDNVAVLPEQSEINEGMNQELDSALSEALNDLDIENYHRDRNGLPPLSPEDVGIDMPMPEDFEPTHSDSTGNPPSTDVELTDKQKKQLQNALDKQRKFNDGNPVSYTHLTLPTTERV